MMKAEYNKQGAARKELADVISQITGEGVKYLFLPTKAYQIGRGPGRKGRYGGM